MKLNEIKRMLGSDQKGKSLMDCILYKSLEVYSKKVGA